MTNKKSAVDEHRHTGAYSLADSDGKLLSSNLNIEGMLPRDWKAKKLGDFVSVRNQKVLPSQVDPDTLCVELEHISKGDGRIIGYSTARHSTSTKYTFCCGDVLFGRLRSYLKKYWHADKNGICTTEIWPLVTDPNSMHSGFLYALVQTDQFIEAASISYGTHMPRADWGVVRNFKIHLPPLPEQRAIAAALSDADGLIGALDALIEKKRAIKQAAMQQLLTGKKRLPGFSGEWEVIRLRDLLVYERPDRYIVQSTEYSEQGDFPVLTANKSFILGHTTEDFGICRVIPVIIFDDFTTESKFVDFPFKVKSSAIKILRSKNDRVDLRFVFNRMQLINFSLGDHKRYYISEYQNLGFAAPSYDEQRAIAAVLSDMDAEIAALERRREKTKQIKQGMMQQLLTGRIRLVEPPEAAA
ncbi:MAG TPA: restriction endonuclease subunit S [Methanoculleus sp.]|nr:restriction endonuclease subunit S [Methanoculleus sp.]